MKKRIFFCSAVFAVLLICFIAMMCPSAEFLRYKVTDKPIISLGVSDIDRVNDCVVGANGHITATGSDPHIIFENINAQFAFVAVEASGISPTIDNTQIFYDKGNGFNEGESSVPQASEDEGYMVFCLLENNYNNLRLDVNGDYDFKCLNLYAKEQPFTINRVTVSPFKYVLAILISLALTGAVFAADCRFGFAERFSDYFVRKRMRFLLYGVGCIIIIAFAVFTELAVVIVFSKDFNFARLAIVTTAMICVYTLYVLKNSIAEHPEKALLVIILTIGAFMIFTAPFGHISYDIDHHYRWALNGSYIGDTNITLADSRVINLKFWNGDGLVDEMNHADKFLVSHENTGTTIAHRLSGVIIAVARLFGADFHTKFVLGQFGNLIIYAVVCYFAMRKLKSGKMILATIALFPTNMFLTTNYSYDYWVLCFSMLGMAYFVGEMQRPNKPLTVKNSVIMCGAFALSCLPKLTYAPLLIIPFFMKKNNMTKSDRKRHFIICVVAILTVFALLAIKSVTKVSGEGDVRGGAVNPPEQLMYILQNPIDYAKMLIKFTVKSLSFSDMHGYMINYAYLGFGTGAEYIIFLLMFTTITDKSKCDRYSSTLWTRSVAVVLYVGIFFIIATALYIVFTPLYSQEILGVQPRYIVPLLFPLLSVIAPTGIITVRNRKVYNMFVLAAASAILLYNNYLMYV